MIEAYTPLEYTEMYAILRAIEPIVHPLMYMNALQYSMAAHMGKFHPDKVDTFLTSLRSSKHLVATPIQTLNELVGRGDLIAVLPQTGIQELPFGIILSLAHTSKEFLRDLGEVGTQTPAENAIKLTQTGFAVVKRPVESVGDYFTRPTSQHLIHASSLLGSPRVD